MTIENLLVKWEPILNHWDALPNRSDDEKKLLAFELEEIANSFTTDDEKIKLMSSLARGNNAQKA